MRWRANVFVHISVCVLVLIMFSLFGLSFGRPPILIVIFYAGDRRRLLLRGLTQSLPEILPLLYTVWCMPSPSAFSYKLLIVALF